MNGRKLLTIAVVALLVFFVVTKPAQAASMVTRAGTGLSHAADSATTFFTRVVG